MAPTTASCLAPHECWALLRASQVGRIAVNGSGGPEIFPVNFVVDHETVVFRTTAGTKLASIAADRRVAFEVDGGDRESGEAWSVILKGAAHVVRDVGELFEVISSPSFPWDVAPKHHFVRIVAGTVTGRRFAVVGSSDSTGATIRRTASE